MVQNSPAPFLHFKRKDHDKGTYARVYKNSTVEFYRMIEKVGCSCADFNALDWEVTDEGLVESGIRIDCRDLQSELLALTNENNRLSAANNTQQELIVESLNKLVAVVRGNCFVLGHAAIGKSEQWDVKTIPLNQKLEGEAAEIEKTIDNFELVLDKKLDEFQRKFVRAMLNNQKPNVCK